jgi:hypothetical protein
MSVMSELVGLLETKVQALLPDHKPMPYAYNLELNDRLADKNFCIRVGSASTVEGTNRAVTIEHQIEVVVSQKWLPKKSSGDLDLRDKINTISDDIEIVYKELYKRPLALNSAALLIIAPLDLSEPEIDNDNNLVSITLTLSVRYRVLT